MGRAAAVCVASALLGAVALPSCAAPQSAQSAAPQPRPRADGAPAAADPTVRGARLVPEAVDLTRASVDAAGTARGLLDGVRFLSRTRGAVLTATQRVDGLTHAVPLPHRLGGGFLFVTGDTVYRAEDWLADPRAIFRSSRGIVELSPGLDRVYVRTASGHVAIDPRRGDLLDLGAWPRDPMVHALVAFDGWRAVALTAIQGLVATSDAGRTWEHVELPLRATTFTPLHRDLVSGAWSLAAADGAPGASASVDAVAVGDGPLRPRGEPEASSPGPRCVVVEPDLDPRPLPGCEVLPGEAPHGTETAARAASAPLRAALLDGWPLVNGTAVVAAEGALTYVSLTDGAVTDTVPDAYDRALGRCHAVALGHPEGASAGFAFVCGVPSGPTALLAYDPARRALHPVRVFASPRLVQTSSAGGWLVRGKCSDGQAESAQARVCVGSVAEGRVVWRDVTIEGAAGALGLTSDGGVAEVVVADTPGSAGAGHLTLVAPDGARSVTPLVIAPGAPRRLFARAAWLGALEERRPGVLGGWLAADGTLVGVEIDADGTVRTGAYVRDLGSPFVAGRYGLGWTRSRRGYETTDGGMTWTPFDAPAPVGRSDARGCGPAGCVADGWLRVGWGERADDREVAHASLVPLPRLRASASPPLWLSCRGSVPREPLLGPIVLGSHDPRVATWFPPPARASGDVVVHADLFRGFDGAGPRLGALGRLYAWGPAKTDWAGVTEGLGGGGTGVGAGLPAGRGAPGAGQGRWELRWRSPFADPAQAASTAVSVAPFADAEMARGELGVGRTGPAAWTVAVSDDGAHALVVVRRPTRAPEVFLADDGGRMTRVTRDDGDSWGAVEAAVRVGSDWVLAAPDEAEHGAVALFRTGGAAGAGARRLGTVHRLVGDPVTPVKLARDASGNAVGVVLDGELLPDRSVRRRWVVPVEVDSGDTDAPESLGAADLSDRADVGICGGGGAGDTSGEGGHGGGAATAWTFEVAWPDANVKIGLGASEDRTPLRQVYARLRVSSDRACVERLTGEASAVDLEVTRARASADRAHAAQDLRASLVVLVSVSGALLPLRCGLAPEGPSKAPGGGL